MAQRRPTQGTRDQVRATAEVDRLIGSIVATGPFSRKSSTRRFGSCVPEAREWSLLQFDDGRIHPLAACAGLDEAIHAMAARVFEEDGPLCAAVGHAGRATESAADALLAVEAQAHVVAVERYRVGAAVGAHTGPAELRRLLVACDVSRR